VPRPLKRFGQNADMSIMMYMGSNRKIV